MKIATIRTAVLNGLHAQPAEVRVERSSATGPCQLDISEPERTADRHRIRLRPEPVLYDGSIARIPAMTLIATGKHIQEWDSEEPNGSIRPGSASDPAGEPLPRR